MHCAIWYYLHNSKNVNYINGVSCNFYEKYHSSMGVRPMFHYYTPGKCQKTRGFLTFSGGKEMKHWHKIGQ